MRTKLVMALAAIGCVGTARAAEKIRYEEIPGSVIAQGGGATVLTIDGVRHAGAKFRLEPDRVVLYLKDGSIENVPVAQIARVEIKRARTSHFLDFTIGSAEASVMLPIFLWEGDVVLGCVFAPVVFPVELAVAAVSAPFTLAADGAALLRPPKVYEIVH
jgi:hypothetical protein